MSKIKTIQMIRSEVKRLNEIIDLKIIQGQSYKRESMRHKSLMSQLAQLTMRSDLQRYEVRSEVRQQIQSTQSQWQMKWYQRPLGFAATFLL